jgi:hypothetical protein
MEADLASCPTLNVFSMRLGTSDNIEIGMKIVILHFRFSGMILFLRLLCLFLLLFFVNRVKQCCLLATTHYLHLTEDKMP